MFYSYGLSIERASYAVYSRVLSTTSGETLAATPRKNGNTLPLGTVELQIICGAQSQFTKDFTSDFGGGPGYVLVTVNKFIRATDAGLQSISKYKFHVNAKAVAAATPESSRAFARRAGGPFFILTTPQKPRLVYARPLHVVVAAMSAQGAKSVKALSKRVAGSVSAQVTTSSRALGRVANAVSGEAGATLKMPGLSRNIQSSEAVGAVKAAGRLFGGVGSFEVTALTRRPGKVLGSLNAEVVAVARGSWPYRLSVASSEAPRLSFGNNLYQRVLGTVDAEVVSAKRGLSVSRGLLEAGVAGAIKTPSKAPAFANTEAAAIIKQPLALRGVSGGQAAQSQRQAGLVRGSASAAVQVMLKAAMHFSGLLNISFAQSASTQQFHGVNYAAQLRRSQVSSGAIFAIRSLLRATGAASAQVATAISQHAAFLAMPTTSTNVARVQRALAKIIMVTNTGVIAVARGIGRSVAATSGQLTAAAKSLLRLMSIVSTESTALIRPHGMMRSIANTQALLLLKLSNKPGLALFSPQATGIGRGDFKIVATTSPNLSMMVRPRGLNTGVIQGQRYQTLAYYHFFVAPWAYQQTFLLPPSGGSAEPPSFGPIDPADQTIFAFDWSSRAYANDAIISAKVTSVPAGISFLSPPFINGTLIEITVMPFAAPVLPTSFSLRCTATFASGRVSSFSIPVPVRTL